MDDGKLNPEIDFYKMCGCIDANFVYCRYLLWMKVMIHELGPLMFELIYKSLTVSKFLRICI